MRIKWTTEKFKKYVEDITNGEYTLIGEYVKNSIKTNIKHNKCGTVYEVRPNDFKNGCRCPNCNIKKKKDTNVFKKEVYELVGKEYTVLGEYVDWKTPVLIRHNKCGREYYVNPNNFKNGRRCKCKDLIKCHKDYVNKLKERYGNSFTLLSEYKNVDGLIKVIGNECGHTFELQANNLLSRGRCPICSLEKKRKEATRTNEQYKKEVYDLVKDEYSVLGEYTSVTSKIKMKHNICGHEYYVTPNNFLNKNRRCPLCNSSYANKKTYEILKSNDVNFENEYSFEDLHGVNNGLLRFDYAIFNSDNDLLFLLELDGEFHFNKIMEDDHYDELVEHDKRKNKYCKDNNIKLIRIPYTQFDNIENIILKEITLCQA